MEKRMRAVVRVCVESNVIPYISVDYVTFSKHIRLVRQIKTISNNFRLIRNKKQR